VKKPVRARKWKSGLWSSGRTGFRFRFACGLTAVVLGVVGLFGGSPRARAGGVELAVVVHAGADGQPLDSAALVAIFTGAEKKWKNGTPIKVFNLAASSSERNEFDKVVLRKTPEQVAQFWVDRLVRGEGQPPTQVPKAELLAKVVGSMPGAIGYVPPEKVDVTKTKIVARIRDGKVVAP